MADDPLDLRLQALRSEASDAQRRSRSDPLDELLQARREDPLDAMLQARREGQANVETSKRPTVETGPEPDFGRALSSFRPAMFAGPPAPPTNGNGVNGGAPRPPIALSPGLIRSLGGGTQGQRDVGTEASFSTSLRPSVPSEFAAPPLSDSAVTPPDLLARQRLAPEARLPEFSTSVRVAAPDPEAAAAIHEARAPLREEARRWAESQRPVTGFPQDAVLSVPKPAPPATGVLRQFAHPFWDMLRGAANIPGSLALQKNVRSAVDAEAAYRLAHGQYTPDDAVRFTPSGAVVTDVLRENIEAEVLAGLPMRSPEAQQDQGVIALIARDLYPRVTSPIAQGRLERMAKATGEFAAATAPFVVGSAMLGPLTGPLAEAAGTAVNLPRAASAIKTGLEFATVGGAMGGDPLVEGVTGAALGGAHTLFPGPVGKTLGTSVVFGTKTYAEGGSPQDVLIAGVAAPLLFHVPDLMKLPWGDVFKTALGREIPEGSTVGKMLDRFQAIQSEIAARGDGMDAAERRGAESELRSTGVVIANMAEHAASAEGKPDYNRAERRALAGFARTFSPEAVAERIKQTSKRRNIETSGGPPPIQSPIEPGQGEATAPTPTAPAPLLRQKGTQGPRDAGTQTSLPSSLRPSIPPSPSSATESFLSDSVPLNKSQPTISGGSIEPPYKVRQRVDGGFEVFDARSGNPVEWLHGPRSVMENVADEYNAIEAESGRVGPQAAEPTRPAPDPRLAKIEEAANAAALVKVDFDTARKANKLSPDLNERNKVAQAQGLSAIQEAVLAGVPPADAALAFQRGWRRSVGETQNPVDPARDLVIPGDAKQFEVPAFGDAPAFRMLRLEDGRVGISFRGTAPPDVIARIKQLGSAQWDREANLWRLPYLTKFEQVRDLVAGGKAPPLTGIRKELEVRPPEPPVSEPVIRGVSGLPAEGTEGRGDGGKKAAPTEQVVSPEKARELLTIRNHADLIRAALELKGWSHVEGQRNTFLVAPDGKTRYRLQPRNVRKEMRNKAGGFSVVPQANPMTVKSFADSIRAKLVELSKRAPVLTPVKPDEPDYRRKLQRYVWGLDQRLRSGVDEQNRVLEAAGRVELAGRLRDAEERLAAAEERAPRTVGPTGLAEGTKGRGDIGTKTASLRPSVPVSLAEEPPTGKVFEVIWADGRGRVHFSTLDDARAFAAQPGREVTSIKPVERRVGMRVIAEGKVPKKAETVLPGDGTKGRRDEGTKTPAPVSLRPSVPASPRPEPWQVTADRLGKAEQALRKYERERGYDKKHHRIRDRESQASMKAFDPKHQKLLEAVKEAKRRDASARGLQTRKENAAKLANGEATPEDRAATQPVSTLPKSVANAIQDAARDDLSRADEKSMGAGERKALQAILDDKGKDTGSEVQKQKRKLFAMLSGEKSRLSAGERNLGVPEPEAHDAVIAYLKGASDAEVDRIAGEIGAAVHGRVGDRGEASDWAKGWEKRVPLAEAEEAGLRPGYRDPRSGEVFDEPLAGLEEGWIDPQGKWVSYPEAVGHVMKARDLDTLKEKAFDYWGRHFQGTGSPAQRDALFRLVDAMKALGRARDLEPKGPHEPLQAEYKAARTALNNALRVAKPLGETSEAPIPSALDLNGEQAAAIVSLGWKLVHEEVEKLKRDGILKPPAPDPKMLDQVSADTIEFMRAQKIDKPFFAMGAAADLPEVRNAWQRHIDDVIARLKNQPEGWRARLRDWIGFNLKGPYFNLPDPIVRQWERERSADVEPKLIGQTVLAPKMRKAIEAQPLKSPEQVHKQLEDFIREKEPAEGEESQPLTPELQAVVDQFKPLSDAGTDWILSNPWSWEYLEGSGLRNVMEMIALRRSQGRTYLRQIYNWATPESGFALPKADQKRRLRGPRLSLGQFSFKRGDSDLYSVVNSTGRGKPEVTQFADVEDARKHYQALIDTLEPEWGPKVYERVRLLDPFNVDELEEKGLIHPIRDVVVLMTKTLMDQAHNIEVLKLLKLAADTIGSTTQLPGYEQMPPSPSLGPAAGMFFPRNFVRGLNETERVHKSVWSRLFRKYDYWFKSSHTVLNPATYGRNVKGLLYNVFIDDPKLFARFDLHGQSLRANRAAAKDFSTAPEDFRKLVREGELLNAWSAADLDSLMESTLGKGEDLFSPAVTQWIDQHPNVKKLIGVEGKAEQLVSAAGKYYDLVDNVVKYSSYLLKREEGLSHEAAVQLLWPYPNYGKARTSPALRAVSKSVVGAPFATYNFEAARIYGRAFRDRPYRFAWAFMFPKMLDWIGKVAVGATAAEIALLDRDSRRRHNWADRWFQPVMPFRDGDGKLVTYDMRWEFPLASEFRVQAPSGGMMLPLLFQHPFWSIPVEFSTGRDEYTGRPLWNEDDGLLKKTFIFLGQTVGKVAPIPPLAGPGMVRIVRAMVGNSREGFLQSVAKEVFGVSFKSAYVPRDQVFQAVRDKAGPDAAQRMIELAGVWNRVYRSPEEKPITTENVIRSLRKSAAGSE